MTLVARRIPRRSSDVPRQSGFGLIRALLLAIVLIAMGALAWAAFDYWQFRSSPLTIDEADGVSLSIAKGKAFSHVVRDIEAAELTTGKRWHWRLLAEELQTAGRLHVGEYRVQPGMTPADLLTAFARGDTVRYRFTIVEGWNIAELRQAIVANEHLKHDPALNDDAALMTAVGGAGMHPEGRFLPETYQFVRGESDVAVLKRAFDSMQDALAAEWAGRAEGLPYADADAALTMASIIEKETAVEAERFEIAGVFVRRLDTGMLLQTDPTVIYGIGPAYAGNITRVHLRTDTPYNTYTRAGLPPTPIAMPGRAALNAALHPAAGEALYFVARGDGSHQFSASLAEHNRAVAQYQLRRR